MSPHTEAVDAPVRVAVLGTGQMGRLIGRILLTKPGLELVGVMARRPDRVGRDAGEVLELDRALDVPISATVDDVIAREPDLVVQATCSRLTEAEAEIVPCLEAGIDVISIAEEMAWPWASSPEWAGRIDALAARNGATLLGTGVNPGFVLDLLVIALSGVCADVRSITASRVNDLSPYGPTVLASQGVGLSPEEFVTGVQAGTVVGHMGFPESIGMIATRLGWQIDRVEERREPIVTTVPRRTPFVAVAPGMVAGCRHTATGYREDRPVITLVHPQQIHPEAEGIATGDTIDIEGTPHVHLEGSPEIPGGIATAALAVNMIPSVVAAPPGLTSMAHLPVPAALAGDLTRRPKEEAHV